MNRFHLESRTIDSKSLLRTKAKESDTAKTYSEPGVYCLNDKPVIIYGRLEERHDKMLWAVKSLALIQEARSSDVSRMGGKCAKEGKERGLGESRIFGFRPRISFNPAANYCSIASVHRTHPSQHHIIMEFGKILNALYENHAPESAAEHDRQLAAIGDEWKIPGTRFTSGIINKNNPLGYHYDRGNLLNVMSCMIVFRELCEGGFLSIPGLGGKWMLDDRSFVLFDGQTHLHGVTPIKSLNKNAYRISVVYYALRAMSGCGTQAEELSRARIDKSARERRRV